MSESKMDLQELQRCAIVALNSAKTEYGKSRVTRDMFLSTMSRSGLEQLAADNGGSLNYWYAERDLARARLRAAGHKLALAVAENA